MRGSQYSSSSLVVDAKKWEEKQEESIKSPLFGSVPTFNISEPLPVERTLTPPSSLLRLSRSTQSFSSLDLSSTTTPRGSRLRSSHDVLPVVASQRYGWLKGRVAKLALGALVLIGIWLLVHRLGISYDNWTGQHNTTGSVSYGILVDAGSSGSRIYVYTWPEHSGKPGELLKMTAAKDSAGKALVMKVEPGLSSYANNIPGAYDSLRPLLDFASSHIPREQRPVTPLYILATAGLRLLPEPTRDMMLDDIAKQISKSYNYQFNRGHVDIISGKMEGVYSWITTNYLLGRFAYNDSGRLPTVGVVDMGGASHQISFEIPPGVAAAALEHAEGEEDKRVENEIQKGLPAESLIDIDLGCGVVESNDHQESTHRYHIYSVTYLGYGANSARERYLDTLLANITIWKNSYGINKRRAVPPPPATKYYFAYDPCLPPGLKDQIPTPLESRAVYMVVGTGNFTQCRQAMLPLLNISDTCRVSPTCSFNGVFQPAINFNNTEFWGLSEFWYSTNDVFKLGTTTYDSKTFDGIAEEYCSTSWTELNERYKAGQYPGAIERRIANQCYKAAWITATLHDGHRFPLNYPLKPVAEVNGVDVQWTLGAMIYLTRFQPLGRIQ
eukprot:Ihof_evm5s190 gene=Ihof_evmTU5s190